MPETIGSLIDRLVTVDMKMWTNQEFLFKVRKMSFNEFEKEYGDTKNKRLRLYESIHKCCDLNFQRNCLIDDIDLSLQKIMAGDIDTENMVQMTHKTY